MPRQYRAASLPSANFCGRNSTPHVSPGAGRLGLVTLAPRGWQASSTANTVCSRANSITSRHRTMPPCKCETIIDASMPLFSPRATRRRIRDSNSSRVHRRAPAERSASIARKLPGKSITRQNFNPRPSPTRNGAKPTRPRTCLNNRARRTRPCAFQLRLRSVVRHAVRDNGPSFHRHTHSPKPRGLPHRPSGQPGAPCGRAGGRRGSPDRNGGKVTTVGVR